MKGITTIFDHKKWVFTYIVLGVATAKMTGGELLQFLMILAPAVLAANGFDKSQWRVHKSDGSETP